MNAPLTQTQADALNLAILAVQRYAAMHPRPSSVVQKDAAQMLGISGATFSRLVRSGRVTLNAVGRVPITEVDRLLAAPHEGPGGFSPGPLDAVVGGLRYAKRKREV